MTTRAKSAYSLEFPLRLTRDGESFFGHGKAELLALVDASGSIAQAAQAMDMSYTRAWKLVREMNIHFRAPLIEVARGGTTGGGAVLTETGQRVLALYREMQKNAAAATRTEWQQLHALLRQGRSV